VVNPSVVDGRRGGWGRHCPLFHVLCWRNSDVVQKLVVQLSCNSKMTHSRVHVGM